MLLNILKNFILHHAGRSILYILEIIKRSIWSQVNFFSINATSWLQVFRNKFKNIWSLYYI